MGDYDTLTTPDPPDPPEVEEPELIDRAEALRALKMYGISTGRWEADVTDEVVEGEMQMLEDTMKRAAASVAQEVTEEAAAAEPVAAKKPKNHTRAGVTKNKGHGSGKAKRKQAAESRRKNR